MFEHTKARPLQISVRDIIVRYREEMRISEASGLPISSIMGNIIPREIYWKFVRYRGLARSKRKGRDWMLEEKKIGVIAPTVFQMRSLARTHARTHVTYVLVGRDNLPTHSCWRLVVDDNGNPIFGNNICLEDRRLTSRDIAVYIHMRIRVCVCMCVMLYEVFHSWSLSSFHPFCDVRKLNWE